MYVPLSKYWYNKIIDKRFQFWSEIAYENIQIFREKDYFRPYFAVKMFQREKN